MFLFLLSNFEVRVLVFFFSFARIISFNCTKKKWILWGDIGVCLSCSWGTVFWLELTFFFFLVGNGLTVLCWIELICGTSYSFICIWTTGGMKLLKDFVVDIETWQIDWGYHLRLKRVVDVAPIISWFCYKQLFFLPQVSERMQLCARYCNWASL